MRLRGERLQRCAAVSKLGEDARGRGVEDPHDSKAEWHQGSTATLRLMKTRGVAARGSMRLQSGAVTKRKVISTHGRVPCTTGSTGTEPQRTIYLGLGLHEE